MNVVETCEKYEVFLRRAPRKWQKLCVLSRLEGRVEAFYELGEIDKTKLEIFQQWIKEHREISKMESGNTSNLKHQKKTVEEKLAPTKPVKTEESNESIFGAMLGF